MQWRKNRIKGLEVARSLTPAGIGTLTVALACAAAGLPPVAGAGIERDWCVLKKSTLPSS